ncbi:MAG: hypothetical protein M3R46_14760 [Actinomycetota bacterium]|nr:hypothetical protein [Actinomycetota bacterium]
MPDSGSWVDARRRGYRRRDSIEERTGELIDQAVEEVRALRGLDVQLLDQAAFPPQARGRARDVIAVDGAPVAAVATVLQTQSGGRQQRDLMITYPQLQADLDSLPCSLLLIVDGRGVAEAGPRTLRTLIGSVGACLSLKQAEQGGLIDALSSAVVNRGARQATTLRSTRSLPPGCGTIHRSTRPRCLSRKPPRRWSSRCSIGSSAMRTPPA